jgi:16S rRNA G527 N7-methylase RsmG
VNSLPPKPEVILTNFFAEPTVLLVRITSRALYYHNDVILYIHSVHKHRGNSFSTSKLQDEIKTEKFELNKFHASKKDPFY